MDEAADPVPGQTDPATAQTERVVGQASLLDLDEATREALTSAVAAVADEAVETIMVEVPSYTGAFSGKMGQTIRRAVQLALANFLSMAARGEDPAVPIAKSTAAAYDLGRGEARSGRSVDALLAAYRIGARVSWRHFSEVAVACDVPAATVGRFAELVFAYIDELSAASVAGHGDETATTGRVRERYLERLATLLIQGEDQPALEAAAEQAAWQPPESLTAVLLPQRHVAAVLSHLGPHTLHVSAELPDVDDDDLSVLLVPAGAGPDRVRLTRLLDQRQAVLGPARPWAEARLSYERAVRARLLHHTAQVLDTESHLAELVLTADPRALADLRAAALRPLAGLKPGPRERLEETLRSWLLHHGRRDQVAADLHVHPQTVRYRMGQVREAFGDTLDDPAAVLDLTIALALEPTPRPTPESG
ncbi:PucR C-terminal helix-turn-helix domain-containing protein [Pedococcus cremeus]|uniref:PucR C-terminal helix-turn-helix domain-containing protein n=1 Tax=Pedococcus cremeus TaxID=587636 RepID=A0A1H9W160_9MICO|nr:helix-turn-helix domain-containing protein [Pedococcus cremeus]SES27680.1 PucR C-terminal helix-turn-helix domain-containing protein [Pedococcus cremeus]